MPFVGIVSKIGGLNGNTISYEDLIDSSPAASALRSTSKMFEKWIGREDIPFEVQSRRLAAYLQLVRVSRSHVSEVDGKQIREDVPTMKARQTTCKFTPDERADYDSFAKQANSSLIRKDAHGPIMWNTGAVRKLIQLSTWTGFYRLSIWLAQSESRSCLRRKIFSHTLSPTSTSPILPSHIWRP